MTDAPKRGPGRPKKQAEPFNGAPLEAFDHDGDGKPGGSKPKRLTPHELTGLYAEAFEAYDMMDERVRFDSLSRKWTFRPAKTDRGESILELKVQRLDEVREDSISTAYLAAEVGKEMIVSVVGALDEALT